MSGRGEEEEGRGGTRSSPFNYTSARRAPQLSQRLRGVQCVVGEGCASWRAPPPNPPPTPRPGDPRVSALVHAFLWGRNGEIDFLIQHPPLPHPPLAQTVAPDVDFLFSVSVDTWFPVNKADICHIFWTDGSNHWLLQLSFPAVVADEVTGWTEGGSH